MNAQRKTENEATLKQLASDIQAGHRRCIDSVRGLISQARCIGEWLNEAKKLVEHGATRNCSATNRCPKMRKLSSIAPTS